MIRVTIELMSAITGRTSMLGRMFIANDGGGTVERGNYNVAVAKKGYQPELWPIDHAVARTGKVTDYPRLAYNVWRLIARSVLAAFPEEIKVKPGKTYECTTTPEVMQGAARVLQSWMKVGDGSYAKELAKGDPTIQAFMTWVTESLA